LLQGVFPGSELVQLADEQIKANLEALKGKYNVKLTERFVEKVLQLHSILGLHHGVMMFGPTGCGKTAAWKILLEALEMMDGIKGDSYVIDPKAITKEDLYGRLDSTTAEWTDGVFT
jgi:dynein heavy chain 1